MPRVPSRLRAMLGVLLSAAALIAACGNDSGAASSSPTPPPTATPAAIADRIRGMVVPEDLIDGRRVGAPDAAVEIVVFEDFRCSHCLDFTANVEPMLLERYVKPGRVSLEIRHYPILGDASAVAAVAAQCALRQGAFWPYQEALFIEQATRGPFTMERFSAIAGELGLDKGDFSSCLTGLETLAEVEEDYDDARSIGFTGTPSVLIDGAPLASNPATLEAWVAILDAALAR